MKFRRYTLVIATWTLCAQTVPAPPPSTRGSDSASISYKNGAQGSAATDVHDVLARSVNVLDFGGKCDGKSHPLAATYPSLAAARAVYPFVTSLTQELDWAAIMAAQNSLPANPAGRRTARGNPIRMGRLLLPASTCVIAETLVISPAVTIQGTGGYGFLVQGGPSSGIQLKDNTATGAEYFVVAVDPAELGGNGTFGVSLKDIQIDCQGGNERPGFTGHNSGSSGLLFYGAQGSTWDNLIVENCGRRGIVMPVSGGSGTSMVHFGSVWIGGVTQGPGLDIPETASSSTFALISAEHINSHGTYKDGDGDANAAIRVVRSGDLHFTQIQTEHDFLPVKIATSWNIVVDHASLSPTPASKCPDECRGPGILIRGGSRNVSIRNWTTYAPAPYVYSTMIADMDNKITLPGNLKNYPIGSYEQNVEESYLLNLRLLGEAWFNTIDAKAVNATAGYQANGKAGVSRAIKVKGANGADCDLVYTFGLLTSTTCP